MRIFRETHIPKRKMETLAFALIAIAFIAAGFFVWFFTFKAKQDERRFLIEKGYTLEELAQTQMMFTFPWRKTGIVLVAAVLGMLLNEMIFNIYKGTVPSLILGAGAGMILANAMDNGYRMQTLWRKVIFGLLSLGIGGLSASILVYEFGLEPGIAVFYVMFCFALALFIENRTSKSTESGE
jgi:hypothetical protein